MKIVAIFLILYLVTILQTICFVGAIPGYLGCFQDRKDRVLTGKMTRSDDMSVDKCRMLCTKLNNKFYGVEGSQYCFCGDTLMKPIKKHWRECNQRCIGNKRQWCGGHWKMHIYSNTGYLGCFQDQKNRVLTGKYTHSSRMTVHGCRYMCGREFYQYYGVEGARYCFCGNTLTTSVRKPERECNQKCTGSKWQRCGGHWKMNIYKNVFVDVTG